eukprot:TRINITY_DN17573_c0_g1_i1.p1 TRINITY_DN17573_c0_g1~~TRINITY_DN17573_c0_g1_i1.p1  ORF type:complete len:1510 (-),score=291.86 TRINITY_DN17573_c0_g1_i1:58-4050(-)
MEDEPLERPGSAAGDGVSGVGSGAVVSSPMSRKRPAEIEGVVQPASKKVLTGKENESVEATPISSPVKFPGMSLGCELKDDEHAAPKGEVTSSTPMTSEVGSPNKIVLPFVMSASQPTQTQSSKCTMESGVSSGASASSVATPATPETALAAGAGLSQGVKFQPIPEADGGLNFFLVDIFEEDRMSRLHLFGKVRAAGPGSRGAANSCFQSCCFVVESIERCLYLLLRVEDPDDEEAIKDVAVKAEAEFEQVCRQHCPGFKKLRAKLKMRNYAFEKKLPNGDGFLPFLKVVYEYAGPRLLLEGVQGGSFFSHIFGTSVSLTERFITSRRIMGPSWIRLQPGAWSESAVRLSFCALEIRGTQSSVVVCKTDEERRRLSELLPSTSPPLRLMSLSMQTVQRSAQHSHEPVAIACTFHPLFSPEASDSDKDLHVGRQHWVAVCRMDSRPFPRDYEREFFTAKVQHCSSETALLTAFLTKIQEWDPDVITSYNTYGFELDVLASRMSALRFQSWQRLGRLRRSKDRMPKMEGRHSGGFWVGSNITAGRLVCDVLLQAKEMLPKLGSYDLPNLARQQLNNSRLQEIEPEKLSRFYDSAKSLVDLAERTFHNSLTSARLVHSLQILPLTKQLTNLAGNTWNASLQNKRAERNEYLLCHEFHSKKFVLPDKESAVVRKRRAQIESGNAGVGGGFDDAEGEEPAAGGGSSGPRRGKAQYTGGLVLEPKAGLYDDFVLMLDFNSLYPSLIQEHNICFTTVDRPNETQVAAIETEAELLGQTALPDGMEQEGVLPKILKRLVDSRRAVKGAMKSEKDPKRLQTLEIRQKAIKLTANSLYGTLGFQNSRFFSKPLAAMITAKGREALQSTISVVNHELSLDVIYGDTDSVFVNSRTNEYYQAMRMADQIKVSVNKRYKKLEIEIDGVFGRLLLLKKKKYAGVKVLDWEKQVFERELKGLDIVRRDWCGIAKDLGNDVLNKVLSGSDGKEDVVNWIHNYLTEQARNLDEGKVPLERFIITRGLTKAPKDYPDAKHQPHVLVALRQMERGKAITSGQEIDYVITEDVQISESVAKSSFAERARHPHEFMLDPNLKVDIAWYKSSQIHPVIARTLASVEGTDAARIAECLGMDAGRFSRIVAGGDGTSGGTGGSSSYGGGVDVAALLDRKARWRNLTTQLPGVACPGCKKTVAWERLLRGEAGAAEATAVPATQSRGASLFRCGECQGLVTPAVAQNQFTIQIRRLLREHCEGWVSSGDASAGGIRSRRIKHGQNEVSERMVLHELEYMLHLAEGARNIADASEADIWGGREAAQGIAATSRRLLDCNGFNWVDCGQLFGKIWT